MLTGQLAAPLGQLEPGRFPGFAAPSTAVPIHLEANDSLDGDWTPWRVNGYELGQVVEFMARVFVAGALANVNGLTVELADATKPAPVLYQGNLSSDGTGLYHASILLPLSATPGVWRARWSVLGQAIRERALYVDGLSF